MIVGQFQVGHGEAGIEGDGPAPGLHRFILPTEAAGGDTEIDEGLGTLVISRVVGHPAKLVVGLLDALLLYQEHPVVIAGPGEVAIVADGALEVLLRQRRLALELIEQRHTVVGTGGAAVDLEGLVEVVAGGFPITFANVA